MGNNVANPYFVSDGISSLGAVGQNPTVSYTVTATDNYIICGADSLAITLNSTSNSPVYISAVDGATTRSGCTIVIGSRSWAIGTNGPVAECTRVGAASANIWMVVGAVSVS